jgi:hypothetical protein
MSEQEKTQAIMASGKYYNQTIASINADTLQAKALLSQNVYSKAQDLQKSIADEKKAASDETNKVRDDARTAIQNMITNFPAASFTSMTPEQKQQMKNLELTAGYPAGMVERGIETMKETLSDAKINQMDIATDQKQQLIDLKAKLGTKINAFTDGQGNATIVYSDPLTGTSTAVPVGQIGKPDSPWQLTQDPNTGDWKIFNRQSGVPTTAPTDNKTVQGAGKKGTPMDALNVPVGAKGGQCGAFVNDYLGGHLMADTYKSKAEDINSTTPVVGAAFVMPYKDTGHTGFVKQIGTNPATKKPGVLVKDSNWGLNEKVQEHWIDQDKISGYITSGFTTTPEGGTQPSTAQSDVEKKANQPITINTGIKIIDDIAGWFISNQEKPIDYKIMKPEKLTDDQLRTAMAALTGTKAKDYKGTTKDVLLPIVSQNWDKLKSATDKANADVVNAQNKGKREI